MQWLLLAVLVATLLYLSRYFPKVAFTTLGLLIAGATVIVISTTEMGAITRSGIPPEMIKIENPIFTPAYANSFRFNGRLVNTHESRQVRESTLSVTMLDCPRNNNQNNNQDTAADDSACMVIGQQERRINREIPPGQARDISSTFSFDAAQPSGQLRWQVKITKTRT